MFRSLSTAVLLLLLALPGVALAQGTGTLAGRVVDGATGETLPGANVRIEGTTLGAAANADGQYRIIGVPVGTYSVTASFIGYQAQTIAGVDINNGYTRDLTFELSSGRELTGIDVTAYRQPLIQRDAIGAPRVTTGEQLQNLPIRGVAAVTALQGGVVSTEGTGGALNIRGGRSEEVAYFVDGVRVVGSLGVNQQAIQEQEMLIGTIPARYGDVQSGVISISTKTGRSDFFGSAEAITSRGLDSYGYNLFSASLGGPVLPGNVGFFLSGEFSDLADSNPYGIPTYRLPDAVYDDLQLNPQVIEVTNAAGAVRQITFPYQLVAGGGVSRSELQTALRAQGLIAPDDSLASTLLIPRAETFVAEQFETVRGKDSPFQDLTFNGNLNFDLGQFNLRFGGGYVARESDGFSFTNSLYNRDIFGVNESDSYRLYGTFRHRITDQAFYQIQGEFQDFQSVAYPNRFSSNIEDMLSYGDADNPYSAVAKRYYIYSERDTAYIPQYALDGSSRPGTVEPGTFSLPGRTSSTTFAQSHNQQFRVSASATAQVGIHQLEFGGEYQQETRRGWSMSGFGLAAFVDDEDGPRLSFEGMPAEGITRYDQLPFSQLNVGRGLNYFGYNYLGTEEVDSQDIDAYYAPGSTGAAVNIAPYRPLYYAGYVQDKIEYRDLIVQLGLRMDVFDNNATVLKDLFAPRPIYRASGVASRPSGIDEEWAVYYSGSDTNSSVVGYRDLDGNFYDREGSDATARDIQRLGQVIIDESAPRSSAFTTYDPKVTFMPRVGVSFPVTDRALFFASYNVVSQRPTEAAFAPFRAYENLANAGIVSNANLRPESTTQYELGFRQRLTETSAVSLSGFYRTQDNKVTARTLEGSFPRYASYVNQDFTTTQGLEVNFDLRRTRNLAMTANYTLSFAQGTGSDAAATATVAWRGNYFPQFISPADFDQRHTVNVTADYRFGTGEGPMIGNVRPLENFGINVIGQFGSGQRYTSLLANQNGEGFGVFDDFTNNTVGSLNTGQLPASSRIDLRVDRGFNLGFQDAKMQAYILVQNLLDTRNVLAVYRVTGLPDQDAFAATSQGQTVLNTPGRQFNYEAYIGGPINVGGAQSSSAPLFYSTPRQVRLGLLFSF